MTDKNTIQRLLKQLHKQLKAELTQGSEAASAVELDQKKIGRLSRMDAMQQ